MDPNTVTPKANEAKYRKQAEEFRQAVTEAETVIRSRWGRGPASQA